MGFVLVIIGLLMVITGGRGTYAQFGSQLASEFQGTNNFTYQLIAIGAIGALGYIPALQTISRWALAFILLVILLGNKGGQGFFPQFKSALQTGPTAPSAVGSSTTSQSQSNMISSALSGSGNPGSSTLAQMSQAAGAGTVNQWLQSVPLIGSWFKPSGQ